MAKQPRDKNVTAIPSQPTGDGTGPEKRTAMRSVDQQPGPSQGSLGLVNEAVPALVTSNQPPAQGASLGPLTGRRGGDARRAEDQPNIDQPSPAPQTQTQGSGWGGLMDPLGKGNNPNPEIDLDDADAFEDDEQYEVDLKGLVRFGKRVMLKPNDQHIVSGKFMKQLLGDNDLKQHVKKVKVKQKGNLG